MDKYEIINRMIIDLDRLTVQGAGNMSIVLRTIDGLRVLTEMLQKEDANSKPKLEVVQDESSTTE